MKKILNFLILVSFLGASSLKAEGVYVGIDYLNNKIDTGITNISSSLDETDNGYSIYGGLNVNPNLDLEFSYQNFGEASLSGVSGNQFSYAGTTYQFTRTATITAEATSIGFAAKPKHKINENAEIYAKIGLHSWDSDLDVAAGTASGSVSDSGTDLFYGLGVQANFENLSARLGYSMYKLDDEDVSSINAGLSFKF